MRLIDADKLREDIKFKYEGIEPVTGKWRTYGSYWEACEMIANAPTVDAAPVVYAHWVGGEIGYCSACGCKGCASDIWNHVEGNGYCPNCGAKMDG